MAKQWKKVQGADDAFTGNVTGTVDGTAASTVKTNASSAKSAVDGNTAITLVGGSINIPDASAPEFSVDTSGNVVIKGSVTINKDAVSNGSSSLLMNSGGSGSMQIRMIGANPSIDLGGTENVAGTSYIAMRRKSIDNGTSIIQYQDQTVKFMLGFSNEPDGSGNSPYDMRTVWRMHHGNIYDNDSSVPEWDLSVDPDGKIGVHANVKTVAGLTLGSDGTNKHLYVKDGGIGVGTTTITDGDINISGSYKVNGTALSTGGTVTSVATSGSISGGAITTSGTITHLTSAGHKHIPTGGTGGQILKFQGASGTAVWAGGTDIPGYHPILNTSGGKEFEVTHDAGVQYGASGPITIAFDSTNKRITIGSNATANVGDITGVTAGTGLSGGGSSGGVTLAFDGSELADGTAAVHSTEDQLIYLDNGTSKRKQLSEINLSAFSNDSGWNSYSLPGTVIHESELSSSVSSTSTTVAANSAAVKTAYDRTWSTLAIGTSGSTAMAGNTNIEKWDGGTGGSFNAGTARTSLGVDTNDTITFGKLVVGSSVCVNKDANVASVGTDATGALSLYLQSTTSQIMFRKEDSSGFGEHGSTNGDYNTYFCMDSDDRGWIFRKTTNTSTGAGTNVASITNEGDFRFDGSGEVVGQIGWSGGNSSNANTAYTHSQAAHAPSNAVPLGATSSTAYRGDRGTTAYNHSQAAHAPSNANLGATVAQGTLATNALPKGGGAMTGALTIAIGSETPLTVSGSNDTNITVGANTAGRSGEQYIQFRNVTTGSNAWKAGMDDDEQYKIAYGVAGEISTDAKLTMAQSGATTFASTVAWSGGSSANANTAYTHSQAAHAPSGAQANRSISDSISSTSSSVSASSAAAKSAYDRSWSTLALGATSSTAYRGDRGTTAYDHSQAAHAPSNANYSTRANMSIDTDNDVQFNKLYLGTGSTGSTNSNNIFVKQLGGNNYTGTLVSNDGSNIRPTIWIQGQYPNVVIASNGNGNHGSTMSWWSQNGSTTHQWNMGGGQDGQFSLGYATNQGNPHYGINNYVNTSTLLFNTSGNATFVGTIAWSGGGSANANTAYTHSQAAHLALGATSSTAYRGDRGTTAYNHSQAAHAPSGAQANRSISDSVASTSSTVSASSAAVKTAYDRSWSSLALGATSSTAYRGDRGTTAYDHSQVSGGVHNTGTTTPSSTETFTNKSGNISQWTNNSNYVTSSGNTTIGTDSDIDFDSNEVLYQATITDGVIVSYSSRNMTLAELGYTGATNANNYSPSCPNNSSNPTFSTSVTSPNFYSSSWFRNSNTREGLYNSADDAHFHSNAGNWELDVVSGVRMTKSHNGTPVMWLGYDDSNGTGVLLPQNWWLNSPDKTEKQLCIGGHLTSSAHDTPGMRLMFGGGNAAAQDDYYIGTNLQNYGGNYTKLDIKWHTGIRMGGQYAYGGIRMYDTEDFGTKLFSVAEGDSHVRITNNLIIGGTVDGRDVASDGSKLDGISAGANVTGSHNCASPNSNQTISISDHTITLSASGGSVVVPDNNTVYTHPTSNGNKHIPSDGAAGQVCTYSSAGAAYWTRIQLQVGMYIAHRENSFQLVIIMTSPLFRGAM